MFVYDEKSDSNSSQRKLELKEERRRGRGEFKDELGQPRAGGSQTSARLRCKKWGNYLTLLILHGCFTCRLPATTTEVSAIEYSSNE
jgi:hypothetical protein